MYAQKHVITYLYFITYVCRSAVRNYVSCRGYTTCQIGARHVHRLTDSTTTVTRFAHARRQVNELGPTRLVTS